MLVQKPTLTWLLIQLCNRLSFMDGILKEWKNMLNLFFIDYTKINFCTLLHFYILLVLIELLLPEEGQVCSLVTLHSCKVMHIHSFYFQYFPE